MIPLKILSTCLLTFLWCNYGWWFRAYHIKRKNGDQYTIQLIVSRCALQQSISEVPLCSIFSHVQSIIQHQRILGEKIIGITKCTRNTKCLLFCIENTIMLHCQTNYSQAEEPPNSGKIKPIALSVVELCLSKDPSLHN